MNFASGTPTNYFYTQDHLGSTREMTKTVSGTTTIEAQYGYDPYGIATKLQGSQDADFQYAGYYMHAPSGLNLPVFRAYSSSLGRFINRDPIGETGGLNLYGYVDNDPVGLSDPFGFEPVNPVGDLKSALNGPRSGLVAETAPASFSRVKRNSAWAYIQGRPQDDAVYFGSGIDYNRVKTSRRTNEGKFGVNQVLAVPCPGEDPKRGKIAGGGRDQAYAIEASSLDAAGGPNTPNNPNPRVLNSKNPRFRGKVRLLFRLPGILMISPTPQLEQLYIETMQGGAES